MLHKKKKKDFKVHVVTNNKLARVLADTGAGISVCGKKDATRWGLMKKMIPSKVKIQPYGDTKPIPVIGEAISAVSFGSRCRPVKWHIIDEECEPILAGKSAERLGIIKFNSTPDTFQPINMIDKSFEEKDELQEILQHYPQRFQGLGKLKGYQAKLQLKEDVTPAAAQHRNTIPYHLEDSVAEVVDQMINDDVIEPLAEGETAEHISDIVIVP